jgi:hypothetical protein
MAKCITWESNLVASAARGLILMNLNQEGILEKHALAARNMGTVSN